MTGNGAAANGIIERAVRTPWYHLHNWEPIEPRETRWHPVEYTEYAVRLQYQKKFFCSCGCIKFRPKPQYINGETLDERWELLK